MAIVRPSFQGLDQGLDALERGRSSGVEHDLAKVGVEGSNPFARSIFFNKINVLTKMSAAIGAWAVAGEPCAV